MHQMMTRMMVVVVVAVAAVRISRHSGSNCDSGGESRGRSCFLLLRVHALSLFFRAAVVGVVKAFVAVVGMMLVVLVLEVVVVSVVVAALIVA